MSEKEGMREAIGRVATKMVENAQKEGKPLTISDAYKRVASAVQKGDQKRAER